MTAARLPSVMPGHPLMPGQPLDVSKPGTIQGICPEEPGTRAWNRRAVRAAGSLGKPNAVLPVNLGLTIGRYRVRLPLVHGILGIRARSQKTKAPIPTVAWTIRRRVDHAVVDVRLTSRARQFCGRGRRGRRDWARSSPHSSGPPRHPEGSHGGQRSVRVARGQPRGSVPSGLARTARAGGVRSGRHGGRGGQRAVRVATGATPGSVPSDLVRGRPQSALASGRPRATRGSIHQACGEAS